jgi:hypothetical protein
MHLGKRCGGVYAFGNLQFFIDSALGPERVLHRDIILSWINDIPIAIEAALEINDKALPCAFEFNEAGITPYNSVGCQIQFSRALVDKSSQQKRKDIKEKC